MDRLTTWIRQHQWRATAAAALVLVVFLLFSDIVPRYGAVLSLYQDWRSQRAKLAEVVAWEAQKAEIEAEQQRLERHFADLYVSLPKSDQMSIILQNLQRCADEVGVTLSQVRPSERTSHPGYDELPFLVELHGTFHGIGRFTDVMERSRYVMKVNGLSVKREARTSQILRAELSLSVIVLKEKEHRVP